VSERTVRIVLIVVVAVVILSLLLNYTAPRY
jgi:hypothetical protein